MLLDTYDIASVTIALIASCTVILFLLKQNLELRKENKLLLEKVKPKRK